MPTPSPQAAADDSHRRDVRDVQKVTTFTKADARRLDLYAAQQDRSTAYLLHRAMLRELDAAGVVDDGVRPFRGGVGSARKAS